MKRTSSLKLYLAFSLVYLMILNGCTTMGRSLQSGYADRESELSLNSDRRLEEFAKSARELGLSQSRNLSSVEAEEVGLRTNLRKAERMIEGQSEREQYFRNKPYMRNDSERLEFLSIPSLEGRQRWLNSKGISGSSTEHPPQIQALIEVNDITIGMTRQAVRDSWGEPETVEVAGNPIYGNERWHYTEEISSTEGFQSERRMVYFESGRVVGWETR